MVFNTTIVALFWIILKELFWVDCNCLMFDLFALPKICKPF